MSTAIDRVRESAKRARAKGAEIEQSVVRKASVAATGAALAYARKKGLAVEYLGVPTNLGAALLGAVVELTTKGAVRRFAGAASDAALAVYAHDAVEVGGFVAGDDGAGQEI